MGTKLSLAPEPRTVRPMNLGHADPRTDWHLWSAPLLPARIQPGIRNGLPWHPWHWLDARRADQLRTGQVLAAVIAIQDKVAGRLGLHGHCAADGDYLSIDGAIDDAREARRGAA